MENDEFLGCGCLLIVGLVIVDIPLAMIGEYGWLVAIDAFVIFGVGIYALYLNNTTPEQRRERRERHARAQEQEKRARLAAATTLEAFSNMTGVEFEEFMADFFRHVGYSARTTAGSGDQGMDLHLRKDGRSIAVQAKRYAAPVGNKAVQEAISAKAFYGTDEAWVVTNSTYTPKARELASRTGVRLIDGAVIVGWITEATREEQPIGETIPEASRRQAVEEARKRAYWQPHPDDEP
jgi:hypothetical protein